jgi:hypothetical protein
MIKFCTCARELINLWGDEIDVQNVAREERMKRHPSVPEGYEVRIEGDTAHVFDPNQIIISGQKDWSFLNDDKNIPGFAKLLNQRIKEIIENLNWDLERDIWGDTS